MAEPRTINRRSFLRGMGLTGLAGGAVLLPRLLGNTAPTPGPPQSGGALAHAHDSPTTGPASPTPVSALPEGHADHNGNMLQGVVDPATNGFDPSALLTDFDTGQVSTLPGG